MATFEMKPADHQALLELPGNDKCIDCGAKHPEWGSISFGILFCASCSGGHRALGTHISRVRSVKMDSWSEEQVQRMKLGGNQQCKEFLEKHGMEFDQKTIRDRYDSAPAELYKSVLDARREGKPEPTELPQRRSVTPQNGGAGAAGHHGVKRKMEGFGSTPPPPPKHDGRGVKLGAYVIASAFVAWYLVKDRDRK